MSNTYGIGFSVSATASPLGLSGIGIDVGFQYAFVRDGATGEWYFTKTAFAGPTGSAYVADVSFDIFKLNDGVGANDLSGEGIIDGATSIVNLYAIQNSAGEILGWQSGAQSNFGVGLYNSVTIVTPISQMGATDFAPFLLGLFGAIAGIPFGLPFVLAGGIGALIGASLQVILSDPLALDLDGDGIELAALDNPDGSSLSNVHFDLDGNGFAERTGWVSSDDGILVRDINQNGTVDNVTELFGSSTVDGFTKLETLDANMDGKIDAADAAFSDLRVWRDFNQNGVSEAGELFTLAQLGITQISVQTQDATGTNAGHDLGVTSSFTRTDGSTGQATSIWFQTDNQDTVPDEAGFVPAADVAALPQLPRSGNLHSAAWVASNDVDFKSHMTALVQNAATMSPGELRASFESLLLEWANVDGVLDGSRGRWVDARHLKFVETFFGTGFTLANDANATILHSPSTAAQGIGIEASFDQIVDTLLTVFLAQVPVSQIAAGADFAAVIASPFFFYSLIDFRDPVTVAEPAETPGNLGLVLSLIKALAPATFAASVDYYTRALAPLQGVATFAFAGDYAAFKSFVGGQFNDIADATLKAIAIASASGNGEFGTVASEALIGSDSNDVFAGSGGNDIILSGAGSDIFIYSKGDGADVIRERTVTANDLDVLVLKDIVASEVTYQRAGETLIINIAGGGSISVEGFFHDWANQSGGLDFIRFSDGTTAGRAAIQALTVSVNVVPDIIVDSTLDDTIRGGLGHDQISIGQGSDQIIWSKGDGYDIISDTNAGGVDTLDLVDVKVGDATVSQAGNNLLVTVTATGEVITIVDFFNSFAAGANHGIDHLRFAD